MKKNPFVFQIGGLFGVMITLLPLMSRADTLGYWHLDEVAQETFSTNIISLVNSPLMNGVTKLVGTGTIYPATAESAGSPIWALDAGTFSATNTGSLLFTQVSPTDSNKNGNFLAVTNTSVFKVPDADAGSTAIRAFTLEFFARVNRHVDQWTDLCGLQRVTSLGASFGFQLSNSGAFVLRVDTQPIGNGESANGYNQTMSFNFSQLRDNKWHHLAISYNGDKTLKVYGDYLLLGTMTTQNPLVYDANSATYLALGWGNAALGKPFDGWIDEVRLSSDILQPEQFVRAKSPSGYWPMNTGVSGSSVSSLPNLTSSSYSGSTKALVTNSESYTAVAPKWTSLVPIEHAQNFLVENEYAIQRVFNTVVFTNASPANVAHSGSQVFFNNAFAGLTNFTAEVFARVRTPIANALIMGKENALGLEWGVVTLASGVPALLLNGTQYAATTSITDGAFHHVAVVIDVTAGQAKLYVDYKLEATGTGTLTPNAETWVLGAGGNAVAFDGWMCGARLSQIKLSIAQMLMLKTVNRDLFAYWHFDDNTNGVRLANVNGEVRSADQNPLLSAYGFVSSGSQTNIDPTPYFSSDVPAPYLWCAQSKRVVNSKNTESIRFVNGVTTNDTFALGSCVAVTNTFVTMPTNLTIELFAKMTTRGILYPCIIEKQGVNTTWMLDMNGSTFRPRIRIDTPYWNNWSRDASTSINDQKWHHLALQLQQISATNYAVRIFVDYTNRLETTTTTSGLLNYTANALRFGTGSGRAWDGWIDEPRITGAILGTNEFIRAFVPVTPPSGYWPLDTGAATNLYSPLLAYTHGTLGSRVEPTESLTPQPATVSNQRPPTTLYVTEGYRSAVRRILQGSTRFTSADTVMPSRSGSEVRIPYAAVLGVTNFTAELFFKVNTATERGVLFGQYQQLGLNWAVQLAANGTLALRFDTLALTSYYPEGLKQEVTHSTVMVADGRWHHVALSYNSVTATARLYVDYTLAATLTLTQPYWPSTDDLVLGAGDKAFDGWMSSFRITDSLLTTEQFLYVAPPDGTLLLMF